MKPLKTLCFIFLLFAGNAFSLPITSINSGDWNNTATWSGGVIPVAGDAVTIANGHTVTVTANAACASVVIGNSPLNQSSILSIDAGISLIVSGTITIVPTSSGTVDNILNIDAGNISCTSFISTNSASDNNRCLLNISTGTLTCSGNFVMGNNTTRNKLTFSSSGLLQIAGTANTLANAQFTPSSGTIEFNGSATQYILPLSYYSLKCSGTSVKLLTANTTLTGNLLIAGTAILDVTSANNYNLTIGGNWSVTSTSGSPFIKRRGTVTFNGTAGVQILSTILSKESFYNLVVNNTAGNSNADIEFNKTCEVTQAYTHIAGTLNLKGNRLSVISDNRLGTFTACNLSGGNIISSVSGAQVSFTDSYDSTYVNFTGTAVGNNSIPVSLTINTGRINLQNLTLYGTGTFTKKHAADDITSGGNNKFYNNVSFTQNSSAGNWYFSSGNGALADSFFAKATFTTYATNVNTKLIAGANSIGNYYGDDVTFYVRSAAGISVGNSSGATNGTASTNYFNKMADVWLSSTGSITFAEGQISLPSTCTFNGLIRIGGAAAATGNVNIGKNNSGSSVLITTTGQLSNGYIYGNISLYLYNITQSGSLAQSFTNTTTQTSSIIAGGNNGACTWNGPVTFTASVLNLSYNNFNGSTNTFNLSNSTVSQNCTGGNVFITGSINFFNNNGTAKWYLAASAADDYNGEVYYRANSTGAIYPAYNTNCTYASGIAIQPYSDSIYFAAGSNGRVTFDGTASGSFINNSSKNALIKRITVNKPNTVLSVYSHIYVPEDGDVTLTAGRIVTTSSSMIILQDENCAITNTNATSTSYIEGPMRIDVSNTSTVNLHFPVGSSFEARSVELSLQHTSNTSYSYTVEMASSNANALAWTNPNSVYSTSTLRWWDITRTVTSSGIAAATTELATSPLPTVSLYYGLNDRANIPANLTICKNTYNALTTWIDIGSSGATNSAGKITSTSSPSQFNSFSRFTLGYYGIPSAPIGYDSSMCGTGSAAIRATPVYGEYIDWYANPTGGTALASNTEIFNTPVISSTTTYYAEARNTVGHVSATRTAVIATIYQIPTVSNFTPTSGESGTTVVITGSDFTNNVSAVSFGGIAAASFTVNSATQITATVSTGASGNVAVTNNCGTGTKTGFVFNPLTVWTGAVNTSWTNAGNWDDGVPTPVHSAIIPLVSNQPQITSSQTIKSITVMNGATVDITVGNNLNIKDSLTNNGSITGGGNTVLSGTSSQIINGTGTYNNLTLNNSSGATILSGAGNMVSITARYTPTAGILTTNDNFTLSSTATQNGIIAAGSASGNYISGKITLERYIPARRAWRLINFPISNTASPDFNSSLQEGAGGNASSNPNPGYGLHITGGTIANGFDQNTSNSPSLKEWTGGTWQGITSTNTAIDNQFPYFVFVRGSRANNLSAGTGAAADNTTLRLSANIKQGNQTLTISSTGWQLTGNPFPSIVNLDAVALSNSSKINRNFVYWDPKLGGSNNVGGYVTASYNGSGYDFTPTPVSPLSEYAQPFAGFYVDAIATGTITVAETNKCNCGDGNVFRLVPPANTTSKLLISLHSLNTDGTTPEVDGTIVTFDNRFSKDKDSYDATKLLSTLSENIAVNRNENKMAIERRPQLADIDTVFLHISNMKVKTYQFEITPENFDTLRQAYLEDSYTGERKTINLSTGGTFQFSIINNPAVYAPNRFMIVFENERIATKSIKKQTIALQSSIKLLQNPVTNNTLQLIFEKQQKGNYEVLISNNEGKQIAVSKLFHDGNDGIKTIAIKKYLPKGQLMLTVKSAEGISSQNILVQ
jgi:hypothetical protein